ncbi:unnamed protein product [Wuchereria bancrofti]|uniref:Uncharacterized protein n=1 Tax=Wuchereria bancrofti TaxID=6293 RepID=A0A3P7DTR8_WUCBA|nr:unnamed protein product [Wuchereria bancrofti]
MFEQKKKKKKKKKSVVRDNEENLNEAMLITKTRPKIQKAAAVPVEAPKRPNQGGLAGTHDPNYQTLAGIGADIFGGDKQIAGGFSPSPVVLPKVPTQGGMVGTHDPNYQTLAAVGADIFGEDKAGGGGLNLGKPANQGAVAGTFDPNYQTLAAVGGDIFGADKKGESPAPVRAPSTPAGKVCNEKKMFLLNLSSLIIGLTD